MKYNTKYEFTIQLFFHIIISKFQSFAIKEGLINYNRSEKFETKQKLICVFIWFITFGFLFAVFTSDPTVWAIIGDPFYYTNDRVLET